MTNATMQRQPKQIVEYNHRTTIEWSYYNYDGATGRGVPWLNLGLSNVFN